MSAIHLLHIDYTIITTLQLLYVGYASLTKFKTFFPTSVTMIGYASV